MFKLRQKIFVGLGYLLVIFSSFLFDNNQAIVLLPVTILAHLSILRKTYNSIPIFLFSLFLFSYTVNLVSYYFYNEYIFFRSPIDTFDKTLLIHSIFIFSLDVFLDKIKQRFYINEYIIPKKNLTAFIFLTLLFVFFIIFGVRGQTILESGGYGDNKITGMGGLGEYFLLLVPLMYIYAGQSNRLHKVIWILSIIITLKLLLFGGRIAVLMLAVILFTLYIDTRKRNINLLKLLLLTSLGMYVLVLIGSIRVDIFRLRQLPLTDILLIPFKTSGVFFANQNDVFYSSALLNSGVESGYLDVITRIKSLSYNILALFVPYSFLPPIATIIPYIQKNIGNTGGGALLSIYFYFFLSYPGVVLLGYYIARKINQTYLSKNNIYVILSTIIIFSTYPRWIGYNVISLFKFPIYIMLMYFFINIVIKRKNN